MNGRRVRSAGSLVWLVVAGAAISAGLGMSGCGRRTYPLRDPPLTPVQVDGSVEIGVAFNQCPELTFNVTPSEGERSQPFDIEGVASDPDNDSLTLSVKADSGKLSVADQLPSTFTCTTAGLVTITVTASDGKCQTAKTATIFCLGTHPTDGGGDGPDGSSSPDGGSSMAATAARRCVKITVPAPDPRAAERRPGLHRLHEQQLLARRR